MQSIEEIIETNMRINSNEIMIQAYNKATLTICSGEKRRIRQNSKKFGG